MIVESPVNAQADFYVTGGTLRSDAPSYVERLADRELYEGLLRGEFCYVLTARQMGKSSLMVRTVDRLRRAGLGVAVLDLTAIGQNLSSEQWYGGMLLQLGQRLNLEDELIDFWQAQPRVGPLQLWIKAIREVVLPRYPGRLVIFIDEIDMVRSLPFPVDEFFAGIRECYNERSETAEMGRLSFSLLGVAAPTDLVRDTRMAPFNIGRRVELRDFTDTEAGPLARGLGRDGKSGQALLQRVLHWTGGHPYLTQRLCLAVAQDPGILHKNQVDRLCTDLLLSPRAHERDDNLLFVRERILRGEVDLAGLLDLYRQISAGKKTPDDETNPLVSALRLSGITRAEEGLLKVRNRIYAQVFDRRWIETSMPHAELRRQRAAYRRGVLRATMIGVFIVALIGVFVLWALREAEANRRLLYYTGMRVAQEEWTAGNADRVVELLKKTFPRTGQEDLRGFEWRLFWRLTHSDIVRLKTEYQVAGTAFSADGQSLWIAELWRVQDHKDKLLVKRYDWQAHKALDSFAVPSDITFSLAAFSPDRQSVAVPDPSPANHAEEATATLWNLRSQSRVKVFHGLKNQLSWLAFSSDGRWLAGADRDETLKIWDVKTGAERWTLGRSAGKVTGGCFSQAGRRLATADGSQRVRLWDLDAGRELSPLINKEGELNNVAIYPDGRRVVTAANDGSLQIWDIHSRKRLKAMTAHAGAYTTSITFSPDGTMLATANYDRTVKIWSTDGQELTTIRGHGTAVKSAAWSPDSRYLVTGSDDSSVKIWDVEASMEPFRQKRDVSYLATAFTGQNDLLGFGYNTKNQTSLWNLSAGKKIATLEEPGELRESWLCGVLSPDRKLIATSGKSDNLIKLWDAATGKPAGMLQGHASYVYALAFSPDGKLLASGGKDRTLKLWDVTTLKELALPKKDAEDSAWRTAFSPDGKYLASASIEGTVKLWDVSARRVVGSFQGHSEWVKAIAFSPDGKRLATGGSDLTVRLWDVKSTKALTTLGMADDIQRIAFSPDGKRLVTGGVNGTVKLWDLTTNQELMTLLGHTGQVFSLTFSQDGTRLATSGEDGLVRLWVAATDAEIQNDKAMAAQAAVVPLDAHGSYSRNAAPGLPNSRH